MDKTDKIGWGTQLVAHINTLETQTNSQEDGTQLFLLINGAQLFLLIDRGHNCFY
jgi:hypothetical protein